MKLPAELDEDLVELLRSHGSSVPERVRCNPALVLGRAELHGLAAVVQQILADAGVELPADLRLDLERRAMARELDHAGHIAALQRIDAAFGDAGLEAVVLKGSAFAERYYALPSGRGTSDTDLMVAEADLEAAARVLASLGYEQGSGPEELRFRREHHHLHLANPAGAPLELHFHAYRGFGSVLPSEPLVARREPFAKLRRGAVGVLSKPDELVYLAVHAAAHRFIRLGWLYDIQLIVDRMTECELETAVARARDWGFARLLEFTGSMLQDVLGYSVGVRMGLGRLGGMRLRMLHRIVGEPRSAIVRSATRLVYGTALCDTFASAARHGATASLSRARGLLAR